MPTFFYVVVNYKWLLVYIQNNSCQKGFRMWDTFSICPLCRYQGNGYYPIPRLILLFFLFKHIYKGIIILYAILYFYRISQIVFIQAISNDYFF